MPDASFLDCWVQGMEYATQSTSGLTEEFGTFVCDLGDSVIFSVGDIALGDGVAGPFMNPIEIAYATDIFDYTATNIARFLQTIDDDGNPSNGIVIIEAVRTAAMGKSVDFNQSPGDFSDDPAVQQVVSDLTAVTAAGTRPLVDYLDARAHLRSTLLAVLAGEYSGWFEGETGPEEDEIEGDWEFVVDADGNIAGTIMPDDDDDIEITGSMLPSGSFSCNDQTGLGLFLTGSAERGSDGLHDVTRFWNDYDQGSGTFGGHREAYPDEIVCP